MIYKDGKSAIAVYKGQRALSFIYRGARLVWQAISSCFGAGYWINEYPWSNQDGWKNNR